MTIDHSLVLAPVSADEIERQYDELAGLLRACVEAGASIGFLAPISDAACETFWLRKVLPAAQSGGLTVLVAREAGKLVGTVQLDHDTPANQPHRAEVRKLLVDPACRRRGIGRRLMMAIEKVARTKGRSLLTLDTRSGDAAEPLYLSLGFKIAGVIPGYCRDTLTERLDPTTVMFKQL